MKLPIYLLSTDIIKVRPADLKVGYDGMFASDTLGSGLDPKHRVFRDRTCKLSYLPPPRPLTTF